MIGLQLLAVLLGGALIADAERDRYKKDYALIQVSERLIGIGIALLGLASSLW